MRRIIILAALAAIISTSTQAAQINQADCNYAIEKLKAFNAAGLVTIYGYLQETPEASPEVTKFCQDNA